MRAKPAEGGELGGAPPVEGTRTPETVRIDLGLAPEAMKEAPNQGLKPGTPASEETIGFLNPGLTFTHKPPISQNIPQEVNTTRL